MPKNFKKLLVCIVATFGITAMVFSCCKKIGLCASSSVTAYSFWGTPYLYGNGVGPDGEIAQSIILSCLDYAISHNSSYVSGDSCLVAVYGGLRGILVVFPSSNPSIPSPTYSTLSFSSTAYDFYPDGRFNTVINNLPYEINISEVLEFMNDKYYYKHDASASYPVYVYNAENFTFTDGTQVFVDYVPEFSAHSKGGVLSNFIDSEDLINNNTDLPIVDTTPPSDTSSNSGWFQKILNGTGNVNRSILGGVLTIGDYIGSMTEKIGEWFQNTIDSIEGFFDRVEDKLDDIIDTIEGLKDGSTISQAQAAWEQDFNNSIFKDFVDIKSTIETDILTPIRNANAPSTLSFTIPLITVNVPNLVNNGGFVSTSTNNVYLFGRSVTLDFSWYTRSISGGVFNGSSIRDYLVPIIATFLYVGMVVHLLFKIPSFLSGSSGFSNTLHSVVVSNNGSKFKKA